MASMGIKNITKWRENNKTVNQATKYGKMYTCVNYIVYIFALYLCAIFNDFLSKIFYKKVTKLSQEDSKPKSLPTHVLDKDDYIPMSIASQSLPFQCQYVEGEKYPVLGKCSVHGEDTPRQVVPNTCHSPNDVLQGQLYNAVYTSDCPLHSSCCQHSLKNGRSVLDINKGEDLTDNTKLRNQKELLKNILEEIRFITDKIRNEVNHITYKYTHTYIYFCKQYWFIIWFLNDKTQIYYMSGDVIFN